MVALGGLSFLTPLDAVFALAAVVPLAALVARERRAGSVRRLLRVAGPGPRALLPTAIAVALLPALVAVGAAQPVVVRERLVAQRADAEAYFVIDTSLSMEAAARAGAPTRLTRAKWLALRLEHTLPDVPVGIASMTDRALPNLLPTTDEALFRNTLVQSVGINEPPPSQSYPGRATTFQALVPLVESHFYSQEAQRRLLIVFTDGEADRVPSLIRYTLQRRVTPLFVHVWQPGERIFHAGRADPKYASDPSSELALQQLAALAGGRVFGEGQEGAIARAARDAVGRAGTRASVSAYARVALAPWFVLAGIVPLGFLLYRRNL
jgi:hypothetical protein